MYLRHDHDDWRPSAVVALAPAPTPVHTFDLRRRVGTRAWWRDLSLLLALLIAAWLIRPPFAPLPDAAAPPLADAAREEARSQAVAPLALGGTSGRRMAATALVRRLAAPPERPSIDTAVTLGSGDTLAQALQRAGVGHDGRAASPTSSREPPRSTN